jgi:hypothetical protein
MNRFAGPSDGSSREEKRGVAGFVDALKRHALLFADYFAQYAKVRVSYRGDFFVSLATSFAATIFALGFVVVLFKKVPQIGGSSFSVRLFADPVWILQYYQLELVRIREQLHHRREI